MKKERTVSRKNKIEPMLTLIKMKWIVMLFLLLYTAGSYLHLSLIHI